jgi:deoxyribodipyrimidine photo-lyase
VPTALLWFRRDLRPADHPALLEAREAAGPEGAVLPLFVVDPRLWGPSGLPRRRFLLDCLADLGEQVGGALVLRSGDPTRVVPDLVREVHSGLAVVSPGSPGHRGGPAGQRRGWGHDLSSRPCLRATRSTGSRGISRWPSPAVPCT